MEQIHLALLWIWVTPLVMCLKTVSHLQLPDHLAALEAAIRILPPRLHLDNLVEKFRPAVVLLEDPQLPLLMLILHPILEFLVNRQCPGVQVLEVAVLLLNLPLPALFLAPQTRH